MLSLDYKIASVVRDFYNGGKEGRGGEKVCVRENKRNRYMYSIIIPNMLIYICTSTCRIAFVLKDVSIVHVPEQATLLMTKGHRAGVYSGQR